MESLREFPELRFSWFAQSGMKKSHRERRRIREKKKEKKTFG